MATASTLLTRQTARKYCSHQLTYPIKSAVASLSIPSIPRLTWLALQMNNCTEATAVHLLLYNVYGNRKQTGNRKAIF